MTPLEVLIDATMLGTLAGNRGVGSYIRGLLGALAFEPDLDVRALVQRSVELPEGIGKVIVGRRAPGRFWRIEHDLRLPIDLSRHVHRRRQHVVHSASPEPPPRWPTPLVQTLYDVIPLRFGDPDLEDERRRWKHLAPRYRAADAIVAISRNAADDGIAALGLDPHRVTVAWPGVAPHFTPDGPRADGEPPYLLLVSEYSKRKGYDEAFELIADLADAGYPHRLRVAGQVAPWVAPAVEAVVARSRRRDRIDILGYVDDLPAQYRGATALVVASRYEGFGLPAVEAMACGTPVVAFANSSIPEVVGDGGTLVADGDVAALIAACRALIDDPARRSELSQRGLARAGAFSWTAAARVYADVYRTVSR